MNQDLVTEAVSVVTEENQQYPEYRDDIRFIFDQLYMEPDERAVKALSEYVGLVKKGASQ